MTMDDIERIENEFLSGNLAALRNQRCPTCGGYLLYSVYKGTEVSNAPPGRRFRCGISIYCLGNCNRMKSHLDGYCPAWAEGISDWEEFSTTLYD